MKPAKHDFKQLTLPEQILLLQEVMSDIRLNWDERRFNRINDKRVWLCIDIVENFDNLLAAKLDKHESIETQILEDIKWDNFYNLLGLYLTGIYEGRILRDSFCEGGYEGLEKIHKLDRLNYRSSEFMAILESYVRTM